MRAGYVGHPLIEVDKAALQPQQLRSKLGIAEDAKCVAVLLGSREKEAQALAKPFLETLEVLQEQHPNLEVIVPTLPNMEMAVRTIFQGSDLSAHIIVDPSLKWDAFSAADVAIAASGTVGLELAYAGVPHVIGYKVHPLTYLILKLAVKVKYAHLANILLDEAVVPEFLQGRCNTRNLSHTMLELLNQSEMRDVQNKAFERLDAQLRLKGGETPSSRAARIVLRFSSMLSEGKDSNVLLTALFNKAAVIEVDEVDEVDSNQVAVKDKDAKTEQQVVEPSFSEESKEHVVESEQPKEGKKSFEQMCSDFLIALFKKKDPK